MAPASRTARRLVLLALVATTLFSALAFAGEETENASPKPVVAEVSESPLIPYRTRVSRTSPLIPYRTHTPATRIPASAAR